MRAALALALGVLVVPARARAQPVPLREEDRVGLQIGVDGTGAPRTHDVAVTQLAPSFDAAFRPAAGGRLRLIAEGSLAVSSVRQGDAPRSFVTRASNVLLGVMWKPPLTADVDIGVLAGAPLVTVPSGGITPSAVAEQADRSALGAAGPRGIWRWARNAVPIGAVAGVRADLGPVRLRLDASPGLLVSVNRDPSRAALLMGVEVAARGLSLEPYLRGDWLLLSRPLDRSEVAQQGVAVGSRWSRGDVFGLMEVRLRPDELRVAGATFWGAGIGGGFRF